MYSLYSVYKPLHQGAKQPQSQSLQHKFSLEMTAVLGQGATVQTADKAHSKHTRTCVADDKARPIDVAR